MTSCDNPPPDDFNDVDLSGTNDEVQIPTFGNKSKRKEKKNWMKECNCHYFGKELACPPKSGTSTMKKHLEGICQEFKIWKRANKDHAQIVLTLDGVVGNVRVSKVSKLVVSEASNEMLVIGELSLSFIESLAWRHFCSKVNLYRPHSRRTDTRDIVEHYVKKKAAMKKILGNNKQRLSLTTNIWVSNNIGGSYMVITTHFVNVNWELKNMIIGFKNVFDYKGGTICKVFLDFLVEWDIKRVFCIIVDNATSNSSPMTKFKKAMKLIGDDALILKREYLHLRCATNILNLVVMEGLQEVDDISWMLPFLTMI
ncbi:unnamed protein product [Arabidopsis halleri]